MMTGALKVRTSVAPDTWTIVSGGVGGMQPASTAETIAGVDSTKAVTPAGLAFERPYLDVRSYGAKGDGTTDDTTAIQAALTAAGTVGTVVFPPGTYKAGDLTARCSIDMLRGAVLSYSGVGTALLIDDADRQTFNLDIRKTAVTWNTGADATSIGVRLRNTDYARVRAVVHNFWVGIDLHGDNNSTSYGVVDCINVMDNKIGLRFSKIGTGWANQHEVRGQIRINSGFTGIAGSRYVDMSAAGNNITFINMALEANTPEFTVYISTPYNVFVNCRFESATGIRFDGVSTQGNIILAGYNVLQTGGVPISLVNSALAPLILAQNFMQPGGVVGPYVNAASSTIAQFQGTWRFATAPQMYNGGPGEKLRLGVNVSDARILAGTGDPNSVHSAPVGSTYHRTDGGALTSFYVKESGSGNTGWVAK